jgi:translation initiation factor IF-2
MARVQDAAASMAKTKAVDIQKFNVIYAVIDAVRNRMEGKIKSIMEKVPRGTAEVKQLFGKGKQQVAGCIVTQGKLMVKGVAEVYRKKELVHEGPLTSLRRFKDDVQQVDEGNECGAGAGGFYQWQEGDRIEFYELVEKTLTLEESKATTAVDFATALEQFEEEYQESLREEAELKLSADKGRGFWKY